MYVGLCTGVFVADERRCGALHVQVRLWAESDFTKRVRVQQRRCKVKPLAESFGEEDVHDD